MTVAPTQARRARSVTARARPLVTWLLIPLGTVLAASLVIFVALSLTPGDPVVEILGAKSTEEQRAALREQLGLNDPLLLQWWHWVTGMLHGDFGISWTYHDDVSALLAPRAATTALLVLMATIIIGVVGISLGSVGGRFRAWRPAVNVLSGVGIAIPAFVAAGLLVSVFAVELGWFPAVGAGSGGLADRVWHLTLPAIALAIGWAAYLTQVTSAAIRGEATREHVVTATGQGLSSAGIFRRHVLRNAAIPITTAFGLAAASLIAGSVAVEFAFGIDGLGTLLIKAVSTKDYPVVLAISVIIVLTYVVVTTLMDWAHKRMDPRLSQPARAK